MGRFGCKRMGGVIRFRVGGVFFEPGEELVADGLDDLAEGGPVEVGEGADEEGGVAFGLSFGFGRHKKYEG